MDGKYDVTVVGAGISGLFAAIASAKRGKRTLLIDKNDFLGGAAIAGLHKYICGLYSNSQKVPFSLLNAGVTQDILGMLDELSGADNHLRIGRVEVYSYKVEHLRIVLKKLLDSLIDLDLFLSTRLMFVTVGKEMCKSNLI